ncbi:MAG TPA: alpha/beta hydrolase [Steroidobacteraceae bacterium]|jgi:hypothetical protein|nr:alpha/beta hydrolase [Steroidobacteraceae bacterium]
MRESPFGNHGSAHEMSESRSNLGFGVLSRVSFLIAGLLLTGLARASDICLLESSLISALKKAVNGDYADLAAAHPNSVSFDTVPRASAPELYAIRVPATAPAGRLLVIFQGDGIAAERMTADLGPLASRGYTIFVQDYRGLGKSGGTPSFRGAIDDARSWIEEIRANPGNAEMPVIYYGTSFGGVVLLAALKSVRANEIVLLDGVPDRLPMLLLCERKFYPIVSIKAAPEMKELDKRLIVVASSEDRKAGPAAMAGLLTFAQENGGTAVVVRRLHHPYEIDDDVPSRLETLASLIESALTSSGARRRDE